MKCVTKKETRIRLYLYEDELATLLDNVCDEDMLDSIEDQEDVDTRNQLCDLFSEHEDYNVLLNVDDAKKFKYWSQNPSLHDDDVVVNFKTALFDALPSIAELTRIEFE